MPYKKNYKPAFKRSFKPTYNKKKTYGKKKRFSSKKTFVKSSLSTTAIKPTTYSRELYQKLRWVKLEALTAPLTSSIRRLYLGNSASPYPPQGALTVFAAPAADIPAGEVYPGGFVENASFYDKFNIMGSSIKIFGQIPATTSGIICRVVLIPIMPSPDAATDTIENMVNQLDAYSFDQLMSYPQAQFRQVICASSGHAQFSFKSFRKTKTMLQFKDMKDQETQAMDMPDTAAAAGKRPASQYQWGYYLRAFNSTGTAFNIETTVTMKLYVRYFQRRFVQAITST